MSKRRGARRPKGPYVLTQFERNLIAALRQGVSFRNSSLIRGCNYHAKRMQEEASK